MAINGVGDVVHGGKILYEKAITGIRRGVFIIESIPLGGETSLAFHLLE